MSRSKYSKRMADGGDVDAPAPQATTDEVQAQAPKVEYDAAKLPTEKDVADADSGSLANKVGKVKKFLADSPSMATGGGFFGGMASGMQAGAKMSKAMAAKADGGPIGAKRAKYRK